MRRLIIVIGLMTLTTIMALAADAPRRVPTVDDLLTIQSVGGTQISPDGKWIAYTIGYGDFKQDAFITQIFLVNSETGKSLQLTRGDKSSTTPRWSPDGPLPDFTAPVLPKKDEKSEQK